MSLTHLTLKQAKEGLIKKQFTCLELTQAYLTAIEQNRSLNAFITETPDIALTQAKKSDEHYQKKTARTLEGLPIGIKDLFCTKGVRTTAASKILENYIPAYESTVTQNLWNQGAVMLGKLNMDEFAMGSSSLTSAFGPCISPWKRLDNPNKQIVPGGSSGGSTTAVSSHMTLAAIGSDTGGSIRQPASFTGLVGIKPTYGLCSRFGIIAFASSLDQAGPLTRTVEDGAIMLRYMAGFDPKDATSLNVTIPPYDKHLRFEPLKIGIPKEYLEGLSDEIRSLLEKGTSWLKEEGAEIRSVSLPTTTYGLPAYYIIAQAEASSNLARYDGIRYGLRIEGKTLDEMYEKTRREGFGEEVRRRIMIGTYVLSHGYFDAYYIKAQKVRTLIVQDFERVFQEVDVLLTPTTPTDAFALDEKPTDPITMYLNDIFTVAANLAGIPGISVPCGLSKNGLPLGLQLLGPKLSEQRLLNVALALETAAQFEEQVKQKVGYKQ